MPRDKSSNETLKHNICNYVKNGKVFFSTHTKTTNKWCLGIHAENPDIAIDLEIQLSYIFTDRTIRTYSNESAAQWCKGEYNVVIVTQYSKERVEALQAEFTQ